MEQIDIIKQIADDMIDMDGVTTNLEFYYEFNSRLCSALEVNSKDKETIVENFQYDTTE